MHKNIIDIRGFSGNKTDVIDLVGNRVFFSEEIYEFEETYYVIKSYDIIIKTLVEVYRCKIDSNEFYGQYVRVNDGILFVVNRIGDFNIIITLIDASSFEIVKRSEYEFDTDVSSIPIFINNRYVLISADIEDISSDDYANFTDEDLDYVRFLIDIEDDKPHMIRDIRFTKGVGITHSMSYGLPLVESGGIEYLFYNETYMDDYEYEEDIYKGVKSGRIKREAIELRESLSYIKLDEFIKNIKSSSEEIPFKVYSKRFIDGWVRYVGISDNSIIYREKDFATQIERINEIDCKEFTTYCLCEIDHSKKRGEINYGVEIYETVENRGYTQISGIYGCNYEVTYKSRNNLYFDGYLDKKYFVTSRWFEDSRERYYEYITVNDSFSSEKLTFIGTGKMFNEYLVVYNQTGFMND